MGEEGQKMIKWLMLVFNLIFWVSGIGLIIAGAIAQTAYRPYVLFLNGGYVAAPVLLIVVGAVIAIIAFLGCCGSSKENYCMLMTFAVLLAIIFVVEMAGGIAGYVERGRLSNYLAQNMRKSLLQFNATQTDATVWDWDKQQENLHCCGVDDYNDWFLNNTVVPESCCLNETDTSTCDEKHRDRSSLNVNCGVGSQIFCPIWTVGCLSGVQSTLENSIGVIGGVAIGVAFIQSIGIGLACFLARRVRHRHSYN